MLFISWCNEIDTGVLLIYGDVDALGETAVAQAWHRRGTGVAQAWHRRGTGATTCSTVHISAISRTNRYSGVGWG